MDGLCYCCYQHRQVEAKLSLIEQGFTAKSDYNLDLFRLYLIYIRRYRLSYFHLKQAQKLADILTDEAWPTINCWFDAETLSSQYDLSHPNKKDNGCAALKIGLMLVELGVLAAKEQDQSIGLASKISCFDDFTRVDIIDLVDWLNKSGRRPRTVYKYLCYLETYVKWVQARYPGIKPFHVSQSKIVEYLRFLMTMGRKPSVIRDTCLSIRRLFARLCYHKKILVNPCAGIEVSKLSAKVNIISESDFKKLLVYIKNPESPPEEALVLALILFFGLQTEDLTHANIEIIGDEEFHLVLPRTPRSYGRHHYNREQILKLPISPPWLPELKLRFLRYWRDTYSMTTQTYPSLRLILPKHHHYTRPLTSDTLIERIYKATVAATGKKISPKVLRQTCGHLNTKNGDASVLSTLGWSPESAFQYTWRPREIVSSDNNSTAT